MIYIHSLRDLTPRTAEIESTLVIRDIKRKRAFPLSEKELEEEFETLFISQTEREIIEGALELLSPLISEIKEIFAKKEDIYEPISLKRVADMLSEFPAPLQANLKYAEELLGWKGELISQSVAVLNAIPKLAGGERKRFNDMLKALFERILRNREFGFYAMDIVNEATVKHINGLLEGMANGFLFHRSLEDEIKKTGWSALMRRIPAEELDRAEKIREKMAEIKKAIDRAYENNMRMIKLAVILFSYVKWAGEANRNK